MKQSSVSLFLTSNSMFTALTSHGTIHNVQQHKSRVISYVKKNDITDMYKP